NIVYSISGVNSRIKSASVNSVTQYLIHQYFHSNMEAKAIVFLLVVIASFYANAMAQERKSMQKNSGRIIDGDDMTRIRRTFYGGPIGGILARSHEKDPERTNERATSSSPVHERKASSGTVAEFGQRRLQPQSLWRGEETEPR
ncbi:hypothetical protein LSTR_LSTR015928, partial [Laodelphax striatellus]